MDSSNTYLFRVYEEKKKEILILLSLILAIIIVVTIVVVTTNNDCPNQAEYCKLGEDNTMCKYCGIGPTCNDQVINNEMTESMKQELLDKHNELRAKVANGQEAGQPSATNMNKLVWDDELASNAQLWANQCPDRSWVKSKSAPHDPDRRTIKYHGLVGQNIAESWFSKDDLNWDLSKKLQDMYDEVKDFPSANVGAFSKAGATGVIGHYTQIVWAKTKYVGCGVIYYKDLSESAKRYPYRKVANYDLTRTIYLPSYSFRLWFVTIILLVITCILLSMKSVQQAQNAKVKKMGFASKTEVRNSDFSLISNSNYDLVFLRSK